MRRERQRNLKSGISEKEVRLAVCQQYDYMRDRMAHVHPSSCKWSNFEENLISKYLYDKSDVVIENCFDCC